jgi:hypothetical protein
MLRWFIRRRLVAFERQYQYDLGYARDLLDADVGAFLALARLHGMSEYRKDLPADVAYAAKLTGTLAEDCGPCTQLMIAFAERDRVPAATLRALLAGDDAALPEPVLLGVRFARATLAHDAIADDLREQVVSRWGARGLVSLAFGLTAARLYPTLKYALGHGRSCTRVTVAGDPAPVHRKAA